LPKNESAALDSYWFINHSGAGYPILPALVASIVNI